MARSLPSGLLSPATHVAVWVDVRVLGELRNIPGVIDDTKGATPAVPDIKVEAWWKVTRELPLSPFWETVDTVKRATREYQIAVVVPTSLIVVFLSKASDSVCDGIDTITFIIDSTRPSPSVPYGRNCRKCRFG